MKRLGEKTKLSSKMSLYENMVTTYRGMTLLSVKRMIITANRFITVIYQKTHHPDGKSMKTALTE